MEEKNILEKIKKLPLFIKIITGIIIILLVLFFTYTYLNFQNFNASRRLDYYRGTDYPSFKTLSTPSFELPSPAKLESSFAPFLSPSSLKDQTKIEIKEGDISIKSQSVDKDYETIKQKTESYNGFIGDYYKTEDYEKINVKISAYVPTNKFDEFFNFLLKNFDVRNSYVKNYKISTKQELNELDIIRQTLNNLNQIEKETLNMETSERKINLLMKINNEKMNLVSRMRSLQGIVEEKMQQGEYSVFSINLNQTKPFKIVVSDYKEAINEKIKLVINDSIHAILNFTELIPFIIVSVQVLIKIMIVGILIIVFGLVIFKFWLYVKRNFRI